MRIKTLGNDNYKYKTKIIIIAPEKRRQRLLNVCVCKGNVTNSAMFEPLLTRCSHGVLLLTDYG